MMTIHIYSALLISLWKWEAHEEWEEILCLPLVVTFCNDTCDVIKPDDLKVLGAWNDARLVNFFIILIILHLRQSLWQIPYIRSISYHYQGTFMWAGTISWTTEVEKVEGKTLTFLAPVWRLWSEKTWWKEKKTQCSKWVKRFWQSTWAACQTLTVRGNV